MVSGSRLACIAVFEGGTQWGQFSLQPSGSQLVGHDPKMGHRSVLGHMTAGKKTMLNAVNQIKV